MKGSEPCSPDKEVCKHEPFAGKSPPASTLKRSCASYVEISHELVTHKRRHFCAIERDRRPSEAGLIICAQCAGEGRVQTARMLDDQRSALETSVQTDRSSELRARREVQPAKADNGCAATANVAALGDIEAGERTPFAELPHVRLRDKLRYARSGGGAGRPRGESSPLETKSGAPDWRSREAWAAAKGWCAWTARAGPRRGGCSRHLYGRMCRAVSESAPDGVPLGRLVISGEVMTEIVAGEDGGASIARAPAAAVTASSVQRGHHLPASLRPWRPWGVMPAQQQLRWYCHSVASKPRRNENRQTGGKGQ